MRVLEIVLGRDLRCHGSSAMKLGQSSIKDWFPFMDEIIDVAFLYRLPQDRIDFLACTSVFEWIDSERATHGSTQDHKLGLFLGSWVFDKYLLAVVQAGRNRLIKT